MAGPKKGGKLLRFTPRQGGEKPLTGEGKAFELVEPILSGRVREAEPEIIRYLYECIREAVTEDEYEARFYQFMAALEGADREGHFDEMVWGRRLFTIMPYAPYMRPDDEGFFRAISGDPTAYVHSLFLAEEAMMASAQDLMRDAISAITPEGTTSFTARVIESRPDLAYDQMEDYAEEEGWKPHEPGDPKTAALIGGMVSSVFRELGELDEEDILKRELEGPQDICEVFFDVLDYSNGLDLGMEIVIPNNALRALRLLPDDKEGYSDFNERLKGFSGIDGLIHNLKVIVEKSAIKEIVDTAREILRVLE